MKHRANNVIVADLPSRPTARDADIFGEFCENNMAVKPRMVGVRRLGLDGKC